METIALIEFRPAVHKPKTLNDEITDSFELFSRSRDGLQG